MSICFYFKQHFCIFLACFFTCQIFVNRTSFYWCTKLWDIKSRLHLKMCIIIYDNWRCVHNHRHPKMWFKNSDEWERGYHSLLIDDVYRGQKMPVWNKIFFRDISCNKIVCFLWILCLLILIFISTNYCGIQIKLNLQNYRQTQIQLYDI